MRKWMMATLVACAAVVGQAATISDAVYMYDIGIGHDGWKEHNCTRINNWYAWSRCSVAIPVSNVAANEEIVPVVVSGSVDSTALAVKVLSDSEMFKSLFPDDIWSKRSEWRDEIDEEDELYPFYDFGYGQSYFEVDTSIWPLTTSPTLATRKWIVISPKGGSWPFGGIRTFHVGLLGGRDYVDVAFSTELNGCGVQYSDLFRGMTISGADVVNLDFDACGEGCEGDSQMLNYCFCSEEESRNSFKISVPSAGMLVLAGWDAYECCDNDLKIISSVRGACSEDSRNDDDDWLSPYDEDEYYSYAAAWGTQVRRLNISKATTLTLSPDSDCDIDLSAIHFFPKGVKSVAVDAWFVTASPIFIGGKDEFYDYFQGYVKGTGVYKVGETVSLTAVAFEGESFDHWEVLYGSVPSGTNLKSPTLSFKVTTDMAGDPEDEEQITVRAVWKDRTRISVLPIPVGAATVSGNGSFVDGAQVPVSLTAAEGCAFEYWQDGDGSGLQRVFEANGGDVTAYAVFSGTPPTPPSAVASAYGPYVPGANVSETIADLVGYAAKGLPTGLKFDSKTGTISGTPTKPTGDAGATVTFTKKNATTMTTRIVVGALPVLTVEVVGGGKVTGAGACVANKKVTLKATANKGNVFAGWYDNADAAAEGGGRGATALPVSRLASYVLAMPTNDVTLYAKFIAQDEDWAEVACAVEDEYATKQEIAPIAVQADGGSLPTVKVTGLPTGLKFTAKDVVNSKTKEVTAASNTIYGTPTKSGVYTTTVTVTTAGKATSSKTLTFVVRADNEKFLKTDYDSTMGKVTGAGIYAAGKKVTLKATANAAKKATKTTSAQEATVFAGWYSDESYQYPLEGASDYRTASFSYTMPEDDTVVYARFVYASEDSEIGLWVDDTEVTENAADTVFYISGDCYLPLDIESVSVPKVAVSGLPSGLKYTAKQVLNRDKSVAAEANTIYGTATKPGTYVVTAKLTNTTVKKAIERKFTIVVDNLTGANDVLVCTDADGNVTALANARGESYALTVGVSERASELLLPRKIAATAGTVKVTGLPAGLKYDAKKGAISGIATKAGTYTVYVTVGKLVSTFTVVVDPLPTAIVGNYIGMVGRWSENDTAYGKLSITVVANGKLSAKVTVPSGTYSFSAAGWDASVDDIYSVQMQTTNGESLSLVLNASRPWYEAKVSDYDDGNRFVMSGKDPFEVVAWRNEFGADGEIAQDPIARDFISRIIAKKKIALRVVGNKVEGYDWAVLASNDKSADLVLTFDAKGNVKYSGKVDGVSVSGTSLLRVDGKDYYAICDLVVPIKGKEVLYFAFGFDRDESGNPAYDFDIVRADF